MSNSLPDPAFPDSRRLRLEAETAAAVKNVETVVEKIIHPAKPAPKPAVKRSHKKKTTSA